MLDSRIIADGHYCKNYINSQKIDINIHSVGSYNTYHTPIYLKGDQSDRVKVSSFLDFKPVDHDSEMDYYKLNCKNQDLLGYPSDVMIGSSESYFGNSIQYDFGQMNQYKLSKTISTEFQKFNKGIQDTGLSDMVQSFSRKRGGISMNDSDIWNNEVLCVQTNKKQKVINSDLRIKPQNYFNAHRRNQTQSDIPNNKFFVSEVSTLGDSNFRILRSESMQSGDTIDITNSDSEDESPHFGHEYKKFDVIDYAHKTVDVNKLKVVEPVLDEEEIDEIPVENIQSEISILETSVRSSTSHKSLEKSDLQKCNDTNFKITNIESNKHSSKKKLTDSKSGSNVSSEVLKSKTAGRSSSNHKRIHSTKGKWKLISLDVHIREIISKDKINLQNFHRSDPRLKHLF